MSRINEDIDFRRRLDLVYIYATTQSNKKAQIYCCNARKIQICKETKSVHEICKKPRPWSKRMAMIMSSLRESATDVTLWIADRSSP